MHKPHKAKGLFAVLTDFRFVLGALFLAAAAVVSQLLPMPGLFIGGLVVLYAAALLYADSAGRHSPRRKRMKDRAQLAQGSLQGLPVAMCLLNPNGVIIWYNDVFEEHFCREEKNPLQCLLQELLPSLYPADVEAASPQAYAWQDVRGHRNYSVTSRKLTDGEGQDITAVFLEDVTARRALEAEQTASAPAVGLISADNFALLEKYAGQVNVSGLIAQALQRATGETDCVLEELRRGSFLWVTQQRWVEKLAENRFVLLDEVRRLPLENGAEATVSVGLAVGKGSLREKQAAAQRALETAQSRGGDQVALWDNSTNNMTFYGGFGRAQRDRSGTLSRHYASRIRAAMEEAEEVMVMGHAFGDFDSFGACVGAARMAMSLGKKVHIVVNENTCLAAKALERMKQVPAYRHVFVSPEEATDLLSASTLLVVCDVSRPSRFECEEIYRVCRHPAVIIDHHRPSADSVGVTSGEEEGAEAEDLCYIEPAASSTGELISEMLEAWEANAELLPCEAEMLLAGIMLDTRSFSRKTGERTFSAASFLRRRKADPASVLRLFSSPQTEYRGRALLQRQMTVYRDVIGLVFADRYDGEADEAKTVMGQVADDLLTVSGIEASFVVLPVGNSVHISARSLGGINVQLITEKLGGGGDAENAGAQLRDTAAEVVRRLLLNAIDQYLKEAEASRS